jgi:septum formation protein
LLTDNEILVTSDTIVWHEGKRSANPRITRDAFEMLRSMSGKTHEVITSVCFKSKNSIDVVTETTLVTFHALSDAEIKYYLDHYYPADKAGSYGIRNGLVCRCRQDRRFVPERHGFAD